MKSLLFQDKIATPGKLPSLKIGFPRLCFTITPPISWGKCRQCCGRLSNFPSECQSALKVIPWSRDLSQPRKILYHELVERVARDPLYDWLSLSASELRSFWSWHQRRIIFATLSLAGDLLECATSQWHTLQMGWGRLATVRCDIVLEETVSHTIHHCPQVHPF